MGELKLEKCKKNIFFEYYYFFIFIFYFSYVFYPNIVRPGVLASILLVILIIGALPKKYKAIDFLILAYILYSFISILFTVSNGFPIMVCIQEFSNSMLPVSFFFLGKKYNKEKNKFYINYLVACFFCYIVGLYWYISMPDYYVGFLNRTIVNFNFDLYLIDKRFSSFIGSTGIGMFSSVSALISFYFFQETKKKSYVFMYFFSIIISLLSMQRASYLMTIIVIIVVNCAYFKKHDIKKVIVGEILISVIVIFCFLYFYGSTVENIILNFGRFNTAIDGRINQWYRLCEIGNQIYLGRGLGSMSHKALGYSELLITDGAYFKMLGEMGIVGLGMIVFIIITTFTRFVKEKSRIRKLIEITIIILFLIQSIGSNSFFYQELAPLFWFSIGIINSKSN